MPCRQATHDENNIRRIFCAKKSVIKGLATSGLAMIVGFILLRFSVDLMFSGMGGYGAHPAYEALLFQGTFLFGFLVFASIIYAIVVPFQKPN